MALHQRMWDQFSRGQAAFRWGFERGSVVMAISLELVTEGEPVAGRPIAPTPSGHACPLSELEVFSDPAQLAFQGDHPVIESAHGSFLRFGGGSAQAIDLTDEPDVTVHPLSHGLDALQTLL